MSLRSMGHKHAAFVHRDVVTCLIPAWPVVQVLMQYRLFWVVLDVIALEFDELVETKLAESLSFAGILPSNPCEILCVSAESINSKSREPTGAG